jgi:hypothetical protein
MFFSRPKAPVTAGFLHYGASYVELQQHKSLKTKQRFVWRLRSEAKPSHLEFTLCPRKRRDAGADVVCCDFAKAFGITPEVVTAAICAGWAFHTISQEIVRIRHFGSRRLVHRQQLHCGRWTESGRINSHCGQTDSSTLTERVSIPWKIKRTLLAFALQGRLESLGIPELNVTIPPFRGT